MSVRLRSFQKAVFGFDAVVRRVDPGRWDDPSPCEEWTARDVVAHQVDVMGMVAAMARGEEPTGSEPVEDPAAAWSAARDDVMEALDTEGALQREGDSPFGPMTVDRLIGILAVDPLTHTWDLARATGQEPHLDEALAERGAAQLEKAGDVLRGPGMYADAVPAEPSTPVADRFIAVAGRDPGWAPPG